MANIINGINCDSGGGAKTATVVKANLTSEGPSSSVSFTVSKAGLYLLLAQECAGGYSMKVNGTSVTPQYKTEISSRNFYTYYYVAAVGDVLSVSAYTTGSASYGQSSSVIIQIS